MEIEVSVDNTKRFGVYGLKRHCQQHFSYIVAKQQTCHKSITKCIYRINLKLLFDRLKKYGKMSRIYIFLEYKIFIK